MTLNSAVDKRAKGTCYNVLQTWRTR